MDPATPTVLSGEIARLISREDMASLPIHRYEGRVCLLATPHDLRHAAADMRQESVVGLDTETRPAFRKGEKHLPCLAQVATAGAVYLFQLRHPDVFPVLTELLGERRIVKAGVAVAHDLRELRKRKRGQKEKGVKKGVKSAFEKRGQKRGQVCL